MQPCDAQLKHAYLLTIGSTSRHDLSSAIKNYNNIWMQTACSASNNDFSNHLLEEYGICSLLPFESAFVIDNEVADQFKLKWA